MALEPLQPEPRHVLLDPDLLRRLMERTGTGHGISGRELARRVGVPKSTIDALLNGAVKSQPDAVAYSICRVIGVDVPILWEHAGRAVPAEEVGDITPRSTVAA